MSRISKSFREWRHPRRCYVVCALSRSGSNLLTDGLRETCRAGKPNQFFLPNFVAGFAAKHGLDADNDFAGYVRGIVSRTVTGNGVFGFKAMGWYLEQFIAKLRQTGAFGAANTPDLEMLRSAFPGLQFLRIVRRNKLRQAISKARALQTGVWKIRPGKTPLAEPRFDPALIARCLDEIRWEENIWTQFFEAIAVEPFRVEYEDLCQNYRARIRSVLDYLEISVSRNAQISEPVTARQADEISLEWEERYLTLGAPAELQPTFSHV